MFVWVFARDVDHERWTPTYINLDQVTGIVVQRDIVAGWRVAAISFAGSEDLTVQMIDEDRPYVEALHAVEELVRGERPEA